MLRALLGIVLEPLLDLTVLGLGHAARMRPRDRPEIDSIALHAHEHLRGRADDGHRPQPEEEEVRRGVDCPERAIDRERVRGQAAVEPARQHDLIGIAGGDERLRLVHGVDELRLVHGRGEPRLALREERGGRRQRERGGRPRRTRQLGERHPDADGGPVVGAVQRCRVVPLDDRIGDDEQPVTEIVEHEQGIGEQEHCVGQPEVVLGRARQALHVVDHVVREEADGAALESGKPRHRHGLELLEEVSDGDERVALGQSLGPALAAECEPPVLRRQDHERLRAQERVARPHLAALDGFEQERVRTGTQAQVGRKRRVEIGRKLGEHRDKVALCRESSELVPARRK